MENTIEHSGKKNISQPGNKEISTNINNIAKSNNHSVKLVDDAKAYCREFYDCSWKNFFRGTKSLLLDYIIYPCVKLAIVFLGFTVLLPYVLYLAVTKQKQKQKIIKSETMNNFINLNVPHTSNFYLWQIRAKAQQIREENKNLCRNCFELNFPMTWPLIGIKILVNKVDNWFQGGKLTEEMHLHQQTVPFSVNEMKWFAHAQQQSSTSQETQV